MTERPARGRAGGEVSAWTGREILATAFFLFYLLVQIAVPVGRLIEAEPARFGWQMFSRVPADPPGFSILGEDGLRTVDVRRYLLRGRWEIDLAHELPLHLCTVHPRAEAVLVQHRDGRVSSLHCSGIDDRHDLVDAEP